MSCVIKELTGLIFGKLTVISMISSTRSGNKTWLCKCSCGNEKIISSDHLTRSKKSVQSCGCRQKRNGEEHPNFRGYKLISGDWWYNHITRENTQKSRNKIEVSITPEYAWSLWEKQNGLCSLSGINLIIHKNSKINTAAIDRIDSSLGYIKNNIQWVHKHVNMMKRTYSQEYFIDTCKKIAKYRDVV